MGREVKMATGVAMGAGKKAALAAMGMFSGVGVVTAYKLDQSVKADLTLHPPHLHWSHSGMIDSLDHASVRRGYQVYKQVCAACPSLRLKLSPRLKRSKPWTVLMRLGRCS